MFESIPEQGEAKLLLAAALEGPAHAYLFHGPAGVGKRATALAFASELLAGDPRVERRTHPDLYVLEPLGDQIRIDAVREMRRDLHMRPFEADRRVYLLFGAHLLNDEAADALLKDLEEPPAYAVIVLVADEVGSLAETIRSRCQAIPFRRLSERAVREEVQARAPQLSEDQATSIARVAGGRLDRAERLLDPASARRREELLETARSVYADPDFDPRAAAEKLMAAARARAAEAKEHEEAALEELDLTAREAEQRVRRAGRGAEREELLAALEELAAWYRDLVAAAAGAESALVHADRATQLAEDGTLERLEGAARSAELVRETWRNLEEFQLSASLALEALFVELHRAFAGPVAVAP
ncbi:MAG: DNA polymerase III subunit [Gaiellaceae bacterium]